MKKTETKKQIMTLEKALEAISSFKQRKFLESVDLDITLNLKPQQRRDVIRGTLNIPNKFGEDKKIIVFCEEKDAKAALEAGAIKAGLESLVKEVEEGFADFDLVMAAPEVMIKIAKLGKVLGPKGLMPSPKNGTITTDIVSAISSYMSGKTDFKSAPNQGVVRTKIGNVKMTKEALLENAIALLKAVNNEGKKLNSNPLKKVILTTTMGEGIKLEISDIYSKI